MIKYPFFNDKVLHKVIIWHQKHWQTSNTVQCLLQLHTTMKFPPCLSHLSTTNLSLCPYTLIFHLTVTVQCYLMSHWDSWFFVFFLPSLACHKMCQNGGTFNESTCTCDCANGFGGDDYESECIVHWVLVMLLSRMEVAYVSLLSSFKISTASRIVMCFLLARLLGFNSGWQIGWSNISTKHKLCWQWACSTMGVIQ